MEEHEIHALEAIAGSLHRLADIAEKFYDALYPRRREPTIATVTVVRSPEQQALEETIQGSEKTVSQWQDIGPREQEFIDRTKTRQGSK